MKKKVPQEIERPRGSGGRNFTELPSPEEEAAALKAREVALREKDARLAQERIASEEAKRILRLWLADEAKKAGPHVIDDRQLEALKHLLVR